MHRSKLEQDKETLSGKRHHRRAVIYISRCGEISCCNKRIEWLAKQCARGGWEYNPKLDVIQLKTSHRLPDRTYIQTF